MKFLYLMSHNESPSHNHRSCKQTQIPHRNPCHWIDGESPGYLKDGKLTTPRPKINSPKFPPSSMKTTPPFEVRSCSCIFCSMQNTAPHTPQFLEQHATVIQRTPCSYLSGQYSANVFSTGPDHQCLIPCMVGTLGCGYSSCSACSHFLQLITYS